MRWPRTGNADTIHVVLILLLAAWILQGCASVPLATPGLDQDAKRFHPPVNQAHLYIVQGYRSGIFQILLDGKLLGAVGRYTYLMAIVPPGEHMLTCITAENQVNLPFRVRAGRNYFVRVFAKLGWSVARVGMEPISEEEGREAVLGAARAAGL